IDGWYVLPGGTRRYEVPLPAADCPKVRSLGIEVQTTRATLTERVDAPEGAGVPWAGRVRPAHAQTAPWRRDAAGFPLTPRRASAPCHSAPAGHVPAPWSCSVSWAPRS